MQCLVKFPPITDNSDTGIKRFYTENSETISWYSCRVNHYCFLRPSARKLISRAAWCDLFYGASVDILNHCLDLLQKATYENLVQTYSFMHLYLLLLEKIMFETIR